MAVFERLLADASATEALGGQLAGCCEGGLLVFLHGHLGAGKTTLVRGLLRGLGHGGREKSPTYTLIEPYTTAQGNLYHLDLYRLADPEELEWIGIRDLFDGASICLIEWPEQGAGMLPDPDLRIFLEAAGSGRQARVDAGSPRGERVLDCLAGR